MKLRIIINILFHCMCAFCWYIKDVINTRKIHGMESCKLLKIKFCFFL
jgi:hypothetical protein